MNLNLRSVCAVALAGFAMWVTSASAQSYQYTYTSDFLTPDGQVGNPYTTADRINISFISDAPMPTATGDHIFIYGTYGGMSPEPDFHSISSFTSSDGVYTITDRSVPAFAGHSGFGPDLSVFIAVDSQGAIATFQMIASVYLGESDYNKHGIGASFYANRPSETANMSIATVNDNRGTIYSASTTSPGHWTVTAVPEPETYAMLLAGLGLIGAIAHRRKATPTSL